MARFGYSERHTKTYFPKHKYRPPYQKISTYDTMYLVRISGAFYYIISLNQLSMKFGNII